MTHPHENDLALFAGGELGYFRRRRVERHVAACDRCRSEVDEFSEMRSGLTGLREIPNVHWERLSGEMRANIRLGLEAGACVPDFGSNPFSPARAWAAYAGLLAFLFLAFWIGRTGPSPVSDETTDAVVLAATGNGIELKHAGSSLSLMHGRAGDVTLSVSAQGAMRARFVDSDTGQVTINNVYVQ